MVNTVGFSNLQTRNFIPWILGLSLKINTIAHYYNNEQKNGYNDFHQEVYQWRYEGIK